MRLLHWGMVGVALLLLMCEVLISHLCRSFITMVDGFQTLFILVHMAFPPPETVALSTPLLTSEDTSTSPPQAAPCPSSKAAPSLTQPAELPVNSPLANKTQAASDQPPAAHSSRGADLLVIPKQHSSPNISPAAQNCGLSYSRSRIQALGVFFSDLLLTSLCASYLMEVISNCLNLKDSQYPMLLAVVGAVSLPYKMLVFGLNWDHLLDEQPEDYPDLQEKHKVLAEEESASQREDEHKAQSSLDHQFHSVVFCNPQSSSIPDCDGQTQQQDFEVQLQEYKVECGDTQRESKAFDDLKSLQRKGRRGLSRPHQIFHLSSVAVLQGLFTSLLTVINSLVMLLLAPQFPHTPEARSPLVYLDPALALLATVTVIASTLPQVLKYGLLLMQATPPHINVPDVGRRIESVPGVQAVHDLHLWQLNESVMVASVHVHCNAGFPEHRCTDLTARVTKVLQSIGVSCCTVQPEFDHAGVSSAGSSGDGSPVIHREDPSPPPHLACSLACTKDCSGSTLSSPLEEEVQIVTAPAAGETKEDPQSLVIENTFL